MARAACSLKLPVLEKGSRGEAPPYTSTTSAFSSFTTGARTLLRAAALACNAIHLERTELVVGFRV